MMQDHYQIIVIQFVNTVVPLIDLYLQKIFNTTESLVDAVRNGESCEIGCDQASVSGGTCV